MITEASIERHDQQEKLKEVSKDAKDSIKGLTATVNTNLKHLKNKYVSQMEEVYLLDDQDNGIMYTYSTTGDIIESRKLLPKEKQTRIININKTA